MTETPNPLDFSHMTVAERILPAQRRWDSVHDLPERLPLTEAQSKSWAAAGVLSRPGR
jgi:hypothetical protein